MAFNPYNTGGGWGGYPPPQQPTYGSQQPPYGSMPSIGGAPPSMGMPAPGGPPPMSYGSSAFGSSQYPSQIISNHGVPGPQQPAWHNQFYNMLQGNEIQDLYNWFRGMDRDNSGSISSNELQMLTFGNFPLGIDTASKLVRVFDRDRSGGIDFQEFASLHKFISLMQQAFAQGDRDRSGTLDCQEIHVALKVSGFQIGFNSVQLIFNKISRGMPTINFPGFLQMGATIALIRSKFEWSDTDRDGMITCNFDQLLSICGDL